ncbi:hypothetical protein [Edaphovirga cremea]|nr:hypothetical protein [Edaphovirga cremea]
MKTAGYQDRSVTIALLKSTHHQPDRQQYPTENKHQHPGSTPT